MSRILLLAPAFHGYGQAIARALDRRGHETTVHAYDRHPTVMGRARRHLTVALPRAVGVERTDMERTRVTAAALRTLDAHRPDVVVVVKGDLLGPAFWARLEDGRIPRVVWLYDELRRTHYADGLVDHLGPVATYSRHDVATLEERGITTRYLPLAFDRDLDPDRSSGSPAPARLDEIGFVGARYPDRERLLLALVDAGVPVRAYGRDWSTHPTDRVRTWAWRRPPVPGERGLDRSAAYRVMEQSAATLNLHSDQDGFTMRTFEASGVGAVQLIDRRDVSSLYEDGVEVASWDSLDELVELCRRARLDRPWAERLREAGRARTLAEHTFDHRVAHLEELWC